MSWVMMMALRPSNTRLSSRRICGAAWMSKAAMGSSKSSRSGPAARALATATRCAWPPESWPGRREASSPVLVAANQVDATFLDSAGFSPLLRGPNATFSRTLRWGNKRGSCARSAVPRECGASQTGLCELRSNRVRSPMTALPESGRSRPAMMDRSDDLPAPLGPSTARVSPGPRASETLKFRASSVASNWNVTAPPALMPRSFAGCRRQGRRPRPPPQPGPGTARLRHRHRSRAGGRFPAAGSG